MKKESGTFLTFVTPAKNSPFLRQKLRKKSTHSTLFPTKPDSCSAACIAQVSEATCRDQLQKELSSSTSQDMPAQRSGTDSTAALTLVYREEAPVHTGTSGTHRGPARAAMLWTSHATFRKIRAGTREIPAGGEVNLYSLGHRK